MKLTKKSAAKLGRAMGWFSVGLGIAEVVGARPIARWLGVKGHEGKIRAFGFRELKAGIGILRAETPTPGQLFSRIVGDVMDLAALGGAARLRSANAGPLAVATVAVVGATAVDVLSAVGLKWGADAGEATASGVMEDLAREAARVAEAFPVPQAISVG